MPKILRHIGLKICKKTAKYAIENPQTSGRATATVLGSHSHQLMSARAKMRNDVNGSQMRHHLRHDIVTSLVTRETDLQGEKSPYM